MRYLNFRLIFFFMFCVVGCNTPDSRYQKETEIFNRYLKTTRLTINRDSSYLFVCTPGSACGGCDQHLSNFFYNTKNDNILLLTSSKESVFDVPSLKNRIYFDSTGRLDRINLPIRNASVIFYEQGKISDIVSVNPDAPDSIDIKINEWLKTHK